MIPAIVLAAGKSTRMGRPKATMSLGPDTFLSRIVRTFNDAGISDVVIVVGHHAHAIQASLARFDLAVRFAVNEDYESGQLSSLLCGLNAVDRPEVPAALMTLVDVPLVAAATVREVVSHYEKTRLPIVRPARGAEHGHPVLIARSLFAELRAADPRTGAKTVVRSHASPLGDIEIDDEGAFLDIDTMEQYERIMAERGARP